jgi:hypothetical protein
MLLAFIVYLVATLGAIKAFVTYYVGLVLALFIVCYLISKFQLVKVWESYKNTHVAKPTWDGVREKKLYKLQKPLLNFNVGDEVYINKFSDYGCISKFDKRCTDSSARVLTDTFLDAIEDLTIIDITHKQGIVDTNFVKLKWLAITMLSLHLLLPTEKTLQYAGAAYLIQSTYESEFVQEAGSLAGKAITNQLRKWATDNPDVNGLLESLEQTKDKAEKLAK